MAKPQEELSSLHGAETKVQLAAVSAEDAVVTRPETDKPWHKTPAAKIGGLVLALATAGGVGGYVASRSKEKPEKVVVVVPQAPNTMADTGSGETVETAVERPKIEGLPSPESESSDDVLQNIFDIRTIALSEGKPEYLYYVYLNTDGAFQEDYAKAERIRDGLENPDGRAIQIFDALSVNSNNTIDIIEYTYTYGGVMQEPREAKLVKEGDRWFIDYDIAVEPNETPEHPIK